MFKNFDFGRHVATVACTILFSAMCVIGAVGPAEADLTPSNQIVRSIA